MRAVVQRVDWAEVQVEQEPATGEASPPRRLTGKIGRGLLVYVGVANEDAPTDADWLAEKVANLRIFEDQQRKMNLSVQDVGGAVLAISNFTLLADARKGRRPAFIAAAPAERARPLHEAFLAALAHHGVPVQTGVFGGKMYIRSQAAGPVNIVIDSPPATGPAALPAIAWSRSQTALT